MTGGATSSRIPEPSWTTGASARASPAADSASSAEASAGSAAAHVPLADKSGWLVVSDKGGQRKVRLTAAGSRFGHEQLEAAQRRIPRRHALHLGHAHGSGDGARKHRSTAVTDCKS